MPSVNEAKFFGAAEFIKALEELGTKVPTSAKRKGLYAGAVILRDEARRQVSVRTGALKKSIVAATKKLKGKGQLDYIGIVRIKNNKFAVKLDDKNVPMRRKDGRLRIVMVKKKGVTDTIYPRNYAHLVEFGTKAHATTPKHKKPQADQPYPFHPGAKPKAFFRPAFDAKTGAALDAFKKAVVEEIAKVEAKAKLKGKKR